MTDRRQTKSPFSLKRAFDLLDGFHTRLKKIEADVRALRDLLNIHDNWPAAVIAWRKRNVLVKDMRGDIVAGKMAWSDRYTFAVDLEEPGCTPRRRVYSKGGFIYLEGDE